jgi:hypothetical protein
MQISSCRNWRDDEIPDLQKLKERQNTIFAEIERISLQNKLTKNR